GAIGGSGIAAVAETMISPSATQAQQLRFTFTFSLVGGYSILVSFVAFLLIALLREGWALFRDPAYSLVVDAIWAGLLSAMWGMLLGGLMGSLTGVIASRLSQRRAVAITAGISWSLGLTTSGSALGQVLAPHFHLASSLGAALG